MAFAHLPSPAGRACSSAEAPHRSPFKTPLGIIPPTQPRSVVRGSSELARWLLYKHRRGCVEGTLTRYEEIARKGIRALSRRGRVGTSALWRESDFEYLRDRVVSSRWAYRILVDFAQFSGNRSAKMVALPHSESSGRVR